MTDPHSDHPPEPEPDPPQHTPPDAELWQQWQQLLDWITHADSITTPDPHTPDPAAAHATATHKWWWTPDNLQLAEYVGHELYLRCRERMHELRLPQSCHDLLIERMIDQHDLNYMNHGSPCVTMVTWNDADSQELRDMRMFDPDEPAGAPLDSH